MRPESGIGGQCNSETSRIRKRGWPVSRILFPLRGDDHSSGPAVTGGIKLPTRASGMKHPCGDIPFGISPREAPIRHCFRWGLPCRSCCQDRGGLLPHRFTLTLHAGPTVLCGAFPRVAPAGRYPAPLLHEVRTFLASEDTRPSGHPRKRSCRHPQPVGQSPVIAPPIASARKSRKTRTRAGISRRPAWTAKIGCGRVDQPSRTRTSRPFARASVTR